MYSEDELLLLSGIQHLAFCERQWALIYKEQEWEDNVLTIQGHFLHRRVDNPFEIERKEGKFFLRGIFVVSFTLGLYGKADLVEVVRIQNKEDESQKLRLKPVEYKRGKPKKESWDEVQLCAQAICLEEMYDIVIEEGEIYYDTIKHRIKVFFNEKIRQQTMYYARRMHELFWQEKLPPPVFKKHCRNCSLYNVCMPHISSLPSVSTYLKNHLVDSQQ